MKLPGWRFGFAVGDSVSFFSLGSSAIECVVGWMVGWAMDGWLLEALVCWLVGWLELVPGWLAGWLLGCLASWLVGLQQYVMTGCLLEGCVRLWCSLIGKQSLMQICWLLFFVWLDG